MKLHLLRLAALRSINVGDPENTIEHYRGIPTVIEYVLVAQDDHVIERYVRQQDENWLLTAFSDLQLTFEFASIAVKIPIMEIYGGITFADDLTK